MSRAWQRVRVLRPVLEVFAGSAGGQAVVVLSSLVVARLYGAEDFGLLTALVAVTALVTPLATLKVEHLVVSASTDREAVSNASLGLLSTTVIAILVAALSIFFGSSFFSALGIANLSSYWWIIGLTVFALGAVRIASAWMTRTDQFGRLGFRGFLQGLGQGATQGFLGLLGLTPIGLLLGIPIGRFCGLAGVLGKRGMYGSGGVRPREVWSSLVQHRRYVMTSVPASALNSMGVQAPLLLIGAIFGSASLGLLGFALRVLGAPIVSLGEAVAQVFEARLGRRVRSSTSGRDGLLARTVLALLVVGLVPASIFFLWGGPLFAMFFGEQWRLAGELSGILAPAFLFQFAATPISRSLYLVSKVGWQLAWEFFRLVAVAGAVLGGALAGLEFREVIVCYAVALVGTFLALIILSYAAARQSGSSGSMASVNDRGLDVTKHHEIVTSEGGERGD